MALSLTLAALVLPLSIMGCTKMSVSPNDRMFTQTASHEWPVRYMSHAFGAFCYNAIGCRVAYANTYQVNNATDEVSPPIGHYGEDINKVWNGRHIGIRNFPEPAKVTWRSKDGVPHEAEIDIGELFKDEIIRTKVPREEVAEEVQIPNPAIILEVNDRTINVYMKTHIPLKKPRVPGNDHTRNREELIRVYTKTY